MTKLLVCEGACNPDLPRVDGEVWDYRRQEARYRGSDGGLVPPLLDRHLLAALAFQKHTPHRETAHGDHRSRYWACTVCGTARRY